MADDAPYQSDPETDGEMLPVVDLDDRQVGAAPRAEIHARGLMHRAIHVVVDDGAGRIVLQHRSETKDRYPGWWDVSVGGHVNVGEAYIEAAIRELREEMGIEGSPPHLVQVLPPSDDNGMEHLHIFACTHRGPIAPHPKEVQGTRWTTPAEFFERATAGEDSKEWRVTPSCLITVKHWWNNWGKGRV